MTSDLRSARSAVTTDGTGAAGLSPQEAIKMALEFFAQPNNTASAWTFQPETAALIAEGLRLARSERTVVPCQCTPADRVECASEPEHSRPQGCVRQSPNAHIARELMRIAETMLASKDTLTATDKDVIRKRLWELYS